MRLNSNSMNVRSGPPLSFSRQVFPVLVGLMLSSSTLTMVANLPAWAQGDGVTGGDNDFLPRSKRGRYSRRISETQGSPAVGNGPGEGEPGPGGGPAGGPGGPVGSGPGPGFGGPGFGGPGFGGPGPGFGGPGPGFGGPGPGFGSRLKHSGLGRAPLDLTSLNLTEEQKNRIKAQRAKSAPRARELQQLVKAKRLEMRDLMFDPAASAKQLTDKRQELRAAQDEAEALMLNDFIGMRSVLTAEQLKHLPELKPGRGLAQRGDSGGGRDGSNGPDEGAEPSKKSIRDKLR